MGQKKSPAETKQPERRSSERAFEPELCVALNGKTYRTVNWNMGGFLIDGYKGRLTPGALVTVSAIGESPKKMTDVSVSARVVRSDHDAGLLVVNFLDIDQPAYNLLKAITERRAGSGKTN